MPRPNNKMLDKKRLKFFDELALLTAKEPDASFQILRKLYRDETNRLIVPGRVFNAVRGHLEKVNVE